MFAYLTMLRRMLRLHKRLITVYMQTSIKSWGEAIWEN